MVFYANAGDVTPRQLAIRPSGSRYTFIVLHYGSKNVSDQPLCDACDFSDAGDMPVMFVMPVMQH